MPVELNSYLIISITFYANFIFFIADTIYYVVAK